jgi:hypothetical protein
MEPVHSLSYYLELQKQLADSNGSRKSEVDVPVDQEPNSLRSGQVPVGVERSKPAEIKPLVGGNSLTSFDLRDVLVDASEKMIFDCPDSLPIERIKAGSSEIVLAFLLFAGLVTFGLACILSPTFLP